VDEKTNLIQQLDVARGKLNAILDTISTQDEIYPEWTVKHLLAHLAGWDDAVLTALQAYIQDAEFKIPAYLGIDDYNAQSVETRKMLNLQQVRGEGEQVREQIKEALRAMPDDNFTKEYLFPWGERGTISELIGIFIHHETAHADEIKQNIANSE
jgi:hypothetical protein